MSTETTEKWARHAPAGAELDRVVAGWMGRDGWLLYAPENWLEPGCEGLQKIPKPFSTSWVAAGPLLEAMGIGIVIGKKSGEQWRVSQADGWGLVIVDAPDPCLAIARACAVLVARGITREDLEDA